MKNSQKGFTYPLTLCLLIIFLLFFSMEVEKLLSERKLGHESAVILQEEYYYLSSVKKFENQAQVSGTIPSKGTFGFQKGNMDFLADPPSGYVQRVSFTLRLYSGELVNGKGYFDTRSKKLIKWITY